MESDHLTEYHPPAGAVTSGGDLSNRANSWMVEYLFSYNLHFPLGRANTPKEKSTQLISTVCKCFSFIRTDFQAILTQISDVNLKIFLKLDLSIKWLLKEEKMQLLPK
jgi:hypothetical protein